MIPNIDIWCFASVMIERYGEDAALEAAYLADTKLEKGDMGGCTVWKCILKAIEELEGLPEGEVQ